MSDSYSNVDSSGLTHERYETILETIRDGVYVLDETGEITWVNDVLTTEFDTGYTREELVGTHVSKLLSESDIRKCQSVISTLYTSDTRESDRCEIALQTKYGTDIPVELHLTLLPVEDGRFQGTVGVVRDITNRKQREEWLQVLNRILRHNLRNQMNVISGRAELLAEKSPPAAREQVETINDAIEELVQISEKTVQVQNALMEARSSREQTDAVEIVTTVCEDFRNREYPVDLSLETPDSARVHADESLAIVIENLLENAVEHTDQNRPTIDVSVTPEASGPEAWVEIRIADEGPGIPPAELETLRRGEVTPLRHGSGIGLWLVKWLVERYGGDVSFRERNNGGSVVTIRLRPAEATDS
jgi:PAS domain S-box-containing protein